MSYILDNSRAEHSSVLRFVSDNAVFIVDLSVLVVSVCDSSFDTRVACYLSVP